MSEPVLFSETERYRAMRDIVYVLQDEKMYINAKGYYSKVIDLLYKFGYYKDNESITEIYNL